MLYSSLSEVEGNEIYSVLYSAGIRVEKESIKDSRVNILVDKSDVSKAIDLLNRKGLPRENFTTMGEVFAKDGLISSPVEEQARYTFAVSQDISSTLSKIDGVLFARVHVVLPEKSEYGKKAEEPSASVFIKHTDNIAVDNLVPKIKTLVANSIRGVQYEGVTVALFATASKTQEPEKTAFKTVGFLRMSPDSVSSFYLLIAGIIIVVLLLSASGVALYLFYHKRTPAAHE